MVTVPTETFTSELKNLSDTTISKSYERVVENVSTKLACELTNSNVEVKFSLALPVEFVQELDPRSAYLNWIESLFLLAPPILSGATFAFLVTVNLSLFVPERDTLNHPTGEKYSLTLIVTSLFALVRPLESVTVALTVNVPLFLK